MTRALLFGLTLAAAACTPAEWQKAQTAGALAYEHAQEQCLNQGDDDAERRACVDGVRKVWGPLIEILTIAPSAPGAMKAD